MKRNKGITLIALVITIIVLLILAGVAISMLSGQNGILKKAAEAKKKTEQSQEEEQTKLAQMEAASNLNGTTHTEKVASIGNKEISVKIPAGFSLSPREGEQKIETGMVIIDQEGNEYVWIPVFEKDANCTWGVDYSTVETKTKDSDEYYTAIETALKAYTANYSDSSCKDVWYGDEKYGYYGYYDGTKFIYYTNGNMKEEEYTKLYREMLKSVYNNGGFYIGRYEMGIAVVNSTTEAQEKARRKMIEYTASTATNTSTKTVAKGAPSIEGMTTPISKANAVPYNWITQSQAQMLAEKLGKKSSYSQVTSSIMFGVQWDAVCVYIEHYDKNNTATTKSDWLKNDNYGKLWGNYKNSEFKLNRGYYTIEYKYTSNNLLIWVEDYNAKKEISTAWLCITGASEQNKSLNIYDFGGNVGEYTLERGNQSWGACVYRGSVFSDSSSTGYASNRNKGYLGATYEKDFDFSSRVALYIK